MMRLTVIGAALARAGLLTVVGSACAQQAPEPAPKPVELQEVTVTAQKRLQASSKVPVALSVVDGDDLKSKGITSAANITELVPNVQIGAGSVGGMEITIRGIGNADNTERGDPQAAFHIDGIYIGRPQGAGATFFDLERVEVLRGPQGTLYGRNANAGAINVISRKPGSKFEGQVDAEVGAYNTRKLEGMVNVPVTEGFALRAVVSSQKHDGYSDTANAANGFSKDRDDRDNVSARVLGLVKFSPTASLLLGLDTSRDKGAGTAYFDITSGSLPSQRSGNPQVEGSINDKTDGMLAEFKYGLGKVDLVYLFGHRDSSRKEVWSFGDAPGLILPFSNNYKQDSHEVRLSSAGDGALQWVAGLYSFKEVGRHIDLDVLLPDGSRAIHFVQDPAISQTMAAFGQATYTVTPGLRGTLGLRYTRDEKSREGETRSGPADTPIGVAGNSAKGKWSKATYKLGAEYDLSPSKMLYAGITTGYKAGGFNDGNSVVGDANYNPNLYYKPESIAAYEAGVKGRFLDNKVQLGASAFYYDYKDLQKSVAANNMLVTGNAGSASVKGLEVEGRAAVSETGRVNFALGLLSAKYEKYTTPSGQDFSGQALDRAPKLTLTLGYTHGWYLASGAHISAYAGTRYSTAYVLTDTGTQTQAPRSYTQPATTKSDITLTYDSADDRWSLQAFVKNIEDKSTLASLLTFNGQEMATLAEPRTAGVRMSFKF